MLESITIKNAEIIAVGTELLMGQVLNTNAHFLSQRLNEIGVFCFHQAVVGDNATRLTEQIRMSLSRADLVILTGGLGPTDDDLTMQTVADTIGIQLHFDEESYEKMASFFRATCRMMPENNRKQAFLPSTKDGIILPNDNGTAPGALMWTNYEGANKIIVCLPGPPNELNPMFDNYALPILVKRTSSKLVSKYVHIINVGESKAEIMMKDIIDSQTNPTIATYATTGECKFRITQSFSSEDSENEDKISPIVEIMKERFGDNIYEIADDNNGRSLAKVVVDMLNSKGLTLGFAESLTGGMASSCIVSIPGASSVFYGGIVSYDNSVKENVLGVSREILDTVGPVSSECAMQMAVGARQALKTSIAISFTGIAGPTGGTPEKPVGTIFVGIADEKGVDSYELHLRGNRTKIREIAVLKALDLLRRKLQ